MKQVTLKRLHAYFVFINSKRTAPKDFNTVEEMEVVVDKILPAFSKELEVFDGFRRKSDEISNKVILGEVAEEDARKEMAELNKEIRKYELKEGEAEVVVKLENAEMTTLVSFFERVGKNWFNSVEDYLKVKKAIAEGNKAEL